MPKKNTETTSFQDFAKKKSNPNEKGRAKVESNVKQDIILEACQCSEMTCKKSCARNHTHKEFSCEKCQHERYATPPEFVGGAMLGMQEVPEFVPSLGIKWPKRDTAAQDDDSYMECKSCGYKGVTWAHEERHTAYDILMLRLRTTAPQEEKVLCCSCEKVIASNKTEDHMCDNCNASCHPNCIGEVTTGSGEYPDEDRYSYCKKCVNAGKKSAPSPTWKEKERKAFDEKFVRTFHELDKKNNTTTFSVLFIKIADYWLSRMEQARAEGRKELNDELSEVYQSVSEKARQAERARIVGIASHIISTKQFTSEQEAILEFFISQATAEVEVKE